MCRAKSHGGRRCPGHCGTQALAAHNERRRHNRAIKNAIIDQARRAGWPSDVIHDLRKHGPREAKDWAHAHGLDPEQFLRTHPPQVPPPDRLADGPAAATPLGAGTPNAGGGHPAGRAGVAPGGIGAPTPRSPTNTPGNLTGWRTQEWVTGPLARQIEAAMTAQGIHRDERSLLAGRPRTTTSAHSGTNQTSRIEFDNGIVAYHKPFSGLNDDIAKGFGHDSAQQSVHEVAAWQLAREMGPPWSDLVPPCVVREIDGQLGSLAVERPGRNMMRSFDTVPEWREAAFFDALIGQQDRHPGNYLISGDRMSLIDHGYAFARPGDPCNYSFITNKRATTDPVLTHQERQVLDRLLGSRDLFGLVAVLEPERAQAVRHRAERMLTTNRVLSGGDY